MITMITETEQKPYCPDNVQDHQHGDDMRTSTSTSTSTSTGRLATRIEKPLENDVISGRGNNSTYHPGNLRFRSIICEIKEEYMISTYPEKKNYAMQVVEKIKSLDPPGRFLKRDPTCPKKSWYELSEKETLAKTRQALRENASNIPLTTNTTEKKKAIKSKSMLRRGGFLEEELKERLEDIDNIEPEAEPEPEPIQKNTVSQQQGFLERMNDYFKEASLEEHNFEKDAPATISNQCGSSSADDHFVEEPKLFLHFDDTGFASIIPESTCSAGNTSATTASMYSFGGATASVENSHHTCKKMSSIYDHSSSSSAQKNGGMRWHNYHLGDDAHDYVACDKATSGVDDKGSSVCSSPIELNQQPQQHQHQIQPLMYQQQQQVQNVDVHFQSDDAHDYAACDKATSGVDDKGSSVHSSSIELNQQPHQQQHQHQIQPLMYQQQQQVQNVDMHFQNSWQELQQIRIQNNFGRRQLQQQLIQFPRGILERFGGDNSETLSDRSSCSKRKRSQTEVTPLSRSDFTTTQRVRMIRSQSEDNPDYLLSLDRTREG